MDCNHTKVVVTATATTVYETVVYSEPEPEACVTSNRDSSSINVRCSECGGTWSLASSIIPDVIQRAFTRAVKSTEAAIAEKNGDA
jgi:hypothetical protein